MTRLVLASSSKWRQAMLRTAGLAVEIRVPSIDESVFNDADPRTRALDIASAKANAVPIGPGETGIAADQVIWDPDRDEIFGKPGSTQEHEERLYSLLGRVHHLYTAFCVWTPTRRISGCEVVQVWLRSDLSRAEIKRYVATGDGSGCAGGYTAEGRGSFMIERIDGDWFAVIGLPLYRVHSALRELRDE